MTAARDLAFILGTMTLVLAAVFYRELAARWRASREWWRRARLERVAGQDTVNEGFWARGLSDGEIRRRNWLRNWLRRRGRLRGWLLARLRAVRGVEAERDTQSRENAEYLQRKEAK